MSSYCFLASMFYIVACQLENECHHKKHCHLHFEILADAVVAVVEAAALG